MKSLQGDNPITPLTEKSILLPDNNNQEQFCPLSQLNNLIHQKQQNQNNQLNPTILTLKNLHYKLNSDHQDLIQRKKNQLRNGYEQQQLQQCPFKPRISHKSIEMKSKDISQPRYLLAKRFTSKNAQNHSRLNNTPHRKSRRNQTKRNTFGIDLVRVNKVYHKIHIMCPRLSQ